MSAQVNLIATSTGSIFQKNFLTIPVEQKGVTEMNNRNMKID